MRIGLLSSSIYMYQKRYGDRLYAPGGIAMDLANGLVEKGHEVFFFTAPDVPTKATIISGDVELLESNYQVEYQQDLPPDMNTIVSFYESKKYYELGLTQKAFTFAKENNLDVMHVVNSFSNLAHYFVDNSIPTIYSIHSMPPLEGTFEYWRYHKFSSQHFVSISESQKKRFKDKINSINIQHVVYHGIRLNEFIFESQPDSYLAFMGRLIPEKGLAQAIAAAEQVEKPLKIATQLNPVLKESDYYQNDILPHLANSQIVIEGFLQGADRTEFLKKAKALLFPIQLEESFGLVMIEAMACGTPVIAYNRGAVSEVIKDGVTGFIIDQDDEDRPGKGSWIIKQKGVEGLVEALKRIDEIDRKACREHVENNFSLEKMVDGYEAIYEQFLKQQ